MHSKKAARNEETSALFLPALKVNSAFSQPCETAVSGYKSQLVQERV